MCENVRHKLSLATLVRDVGWAGPRYAAEAARVLTLLHAPQVQGQARSEEDRLEHVQRQDTDGRVDTEGAQSWDYLRTVEIKGKYSIINVVRISLIIFCKDILE